MKIVEVKHPLVKHKLGLMREQDISTKRFRELASEVGSLLTYEATADLETEKVTIEGWNGPVEIDQIKGKKITVVPILRAGLGMMDGVLENVPSARISVVGMYRNEETLEPVPYFQKLVSNIDERMALIVDPMLATGGSVIATIDLLKKAGCSSIKVLVLVAAPEGIAALEKAHPDVELYTASIDQGLNEHGYIIPGLGDAGDKIFATMATVRVLTPKILTISSRQFSVSMPARAVNAPPHAATILKSKWRYSSKKRLLSISVPSAITCRFITPLA